MLQEAVATLKDQAQSLKDEAHDAMTKAHDEAGALRDQAQAEYDALHAQAQAGMNEFHSEFDEQYAGAKVMLMNVAVSYGMSLLQMGFAFLISSPAVRAWIIDMLIRMMKAKAMRVLREKGVETAFEDVFQTKMTKTRDSLLKIIVYAQKISSIVNVPSLSMFGGGDGASSPAAALTNALNPTSEGSDKKSKGGLAGFGRMLSGRASKK
jgi:hypothetical protein